jgi:hypothetical protein
MSTEAFENFFILYELENGQKKIHVIQYPEFESLGNFTEISYYVDYSEDVYSILPGNMDDNHPMPFR